MRFHTGHAGPTVSNRTLAVGSVQIIATCPSRPGPRRRGPLRSGQIPQAGPKLGSCPFAEQRPLAGSEWVISVVSPRRAVEDDVFWALFTPALSALNGPDEHPDELDAMAMVACAPLAILAQDGKHTQLRVRVQDVVGVEDAPRRFSPSTGGSFVYLLASGGLNVLTASPTSDLLYYSYNFEGDLGSLGRVQGHGNEPNCRPVRRVGFPHGLCRDGKSTAHRRGSLDDGPAVRATTTLSGSRRSA